MQKQTCIIDLSGTEIRAGMLADGQFQMIDINLPWEIGFRQEDDTLVACFGEELKGINTNRPNEVDFKTLDVKLKDISDPKTLECLFGAFIEEIFHRRLREHGYAIEVMSVYVITPYQWTPVHREQLRNAFNRVSRELPTVSFITSKMRLRGMLSQILCLTIFFLKDISDTHNELQLYLIDFTRSNILLYQLYCKESLNSRHVELRDILCFTDYFMDVLKSVSDVRNIIQKSEDDVPIVVGFSGRIDVDANRTINLLQSRDGGIDLEPQEKATLLGGAELIQQFEQQTLEKSIHFVHAFCFGVQLPDGKCVELIPKTWIPPYTWKKAFSVSKNEEKFDVCLICGLSVTERSDVHNIATLEIDITNRNSKDFVLSVSLHSTSHGTFAVHLPNSQEQISVDFTMPVLMD